MTTSEWISVIAFAISSGGFALQARNWLASKAQKIYIPKLGYLFLGEQ
jgi:hypothetical protein